MGFQSTELGDPINLAGNFSEFSLGSLSAIGWPAGDWTGQLSDVPVTIFTNESKLGFLPLAFVFVNTTGDLSSLEAEGSQIDAQLSDFLYDKGSAYLKELSGTNQVSWLPIGNFSLDSVAPQGVFLRSGIIQPGVSITYWIDSNPGQPGRILTLGLYVPLGS